MAEYWFAYTGPKHWMDLFETHMQCQPMVIEGIAPNGQRFSQEMHGIFEPIKMARYVVPDAALPMTHNTLGHLGANHGTLFNVGTAALRKSLGLEPIPEYPITNARLKVSTDYMHVIPIGLKTEEKRIMHTTGVEQEPI